MNNITAKIFGINRHRIQLDGDGIRSLVFFSGCTLRCKYCINPQSWDNSRVPHEYSIEQLYDTLSVDNLYFQATNGGITFGGGEPLLQAKFIHAFIDYAPQTWNYWVETSLAVPYENIKLVSNQISRFIVDIKTLDPQIYRQYTGAEASLAYNNLLRLIADIGTEKIIVCAPFIPNYTTKEQQEEAHRHLLDIGITNIEMFDYVVRNKLTRS